MIHYFNPGHETAVLNESKFYHAPANVRKMQEDLAFLPAWYALPGDFVLTARSLPDTFKAMLEKLNFSVHAFTEETIAEAQDALANQSVAFWGISPQMIHLFHTISAKHHLSWDIPAWHSEYKALNGRRLSQQCLQYIQSELPTIEKELLPTFFHSPDEIERANASANSPMLLKAPYSSSGRGLLWLEEKVLSRSSRQIISGILKKQGEASLEKALNKVLDFSMHFIGNRFLGLSLFETNAKGSYEKTLLASQERITARLLPYIDWQLLDNIKQCAATFIEKQILPYYQGNIGIDMMIYQSADGYRVHPCVEINPRKSMGYLAMRVYEQYVAPDSEGYFSVLYNQTPSKETPPTLVNNRIKEGTLDLCPVTAHTKYRAIIAVMERG